MSAPGLSAVGVTRVGNGDECTGVSIGQEDAITVDNTVSPPVVTMGGFLLASTAALALFGDGADGDLTVPANTTQTIAKNTYYRNLTVQDGAVLDSGGYVVYVAGTLTLAGTGRVGRNGNSAIANVAGTGFSGGGNTFLGNSSSGGAGGAAGSNGGAGSATNNSMGSSGGGGGSGNSGSTLGGIVGLPVLPLASLGGTGWWRCDPYTVLTAMVSPRATNLMVGGGGGSGGGGSNGGSGGLGGGGGAGGGVVVVSARTITGTGSITALGGNGGVGGSAGVGAGGGGGGGGGVVALIYANAVGFTSSQLRATGGLGGAAGSAGGQPGGNGLDGSVVVHQV